MQILECVSFANVRRCSADNGMTKVSTGTEIMLSISGRTKVFNLHMTHD